MALFDLKTLNAALDELQQERGISRDSVVDAKTRKFWQKCAQLTGPVDWAQLTG